MHSILDSWLTVLVKSPLIRARILAVVRWALGIGGTYLASWLTQAGLSANDVGTIVSSLTGVGLVLVAGLLGQQDVTGVDKKIAIALTAAPGTQKADIDAMAAGKF